MPREMHPKAQEAAEWIATYRIVPTIDPREKTLREILEIVRWMRDIYRMRVVEILNRRRDKLAIRAMGRVRKLGMLPLLGTGVKGKHVREAIEEGAVGYISPGKNSKAISAALRRRDGARLAIPTITTPGDYFDVLDDKTDAMGVEYASELPPELRWNKVFPGVEGNPIQPHADNPREANTYLRRMLGPAMEEELNFHMLVTGHDRPEQALPYLQVHSVGGKPITTATGPALTTPQEAHAWCEAVARSQEDSPWHDILAEVRRRVKGVSHLRHRKARAGRSSRAA